jgi:SAM-dependent methyltransferase
MLRFSAPESIDADLVDAEYIRQRLRPEWGDRFYLVLSDLLVALKRLETPERLTVLDYGAGGSPYRSLFHNSEYRRADILSSTGCDYLIAEDGTVPEKAATFDLVLSTQVLEHVENPSSYLSECFRLLRPGGKLVLTTHGSYEDHECPYDFWRWTADGLRRDLIEAGFEILVLEKLTTGPRAIMFLIERYLRMASFSRRTLPGMMLWTCQKLLSRCRHWLHSALDRYSANCRVVSADMPDCKIYLCLLCYARRP